jgi:hypothetical protein
MADPTQQADDAVVYSARADKSGLFIGSMVLIVIVVPMLIHLGKMAFGVSG